MPCMGPSREHAYEQGEKAFKEIAEMINKKYFFDISKEMKHSPFAEDYNKHVTQFKELLKEIFWDDACDGF